MNQPTIQPKEHNAGVALSTAHISNEDAADLPYFATAPSHFFSREYGYFFIVPEDNALFIDLFSGKVGESVYALLQWARSQGFRYVELDQDAPIEPFLINYQQD
ncbi:hypothetical protein [Aliidiomarina quisquiliarum]|uniref:DUF5983 family protein n=1 Tax=Aliidiomarina quisquiliarum TaxID=2938947 RepID=UPI00208E36F5|nr:hypothetical protein [Aliidiomarina quisquiliarum]MCO4319973.1 hypothetical protein [Aliidiomarina quisquiliarum]